MLRQFLFLLIAVTFLSCKQNQDKSFQIFLEEFQDAAQKEVLFQALHQKKLCIDSTLVHPQKDKVQQVLDFSKEHLQKLNTIEKERLDLKLHGKYDSLNSHLNVLIKNIEEEKIHNSDPGFYSNQLFLKSLIQQNDSNLFQGLKDLEMHYETAIENLKTPMPDKLENVVTEGIASYEFMDIEVRKHIRSFKLETISEQKLMQQLQTVQLGIKNYIAFCNSKIFDNQN